MDKKENIIPNKRRRITPSVSTNLTCSGRESSTNVVNILDLCDDFLLEIFDYLNLFDWSSVAGTCKRFKQIASHLFIRKFEYFDIDKVKRHFPSLVNNDTISLEVFNGIFREFGPLIKGFSAQLAQGENKNCSKKAIVRFCHQSLRLNIIHLKIDAELFAILDPVLKRLSTLRLINCKLIRSAVLNQYPRNKYLSLSDMKISNAKLFSQCNQIESLNLTNVKLNAEIWNQHFPKLIGFNFDHLSVQVEEMTNFFRKNPQLKHIGIFRCKNLDESTLVSIGKYLPNVITLTWFSNKIDPQIDLRQMPKLSQLSSLSLYCKGVEMSLLVNALLSEINLLQYLMFRECMFDNEFDKSVIKLHHLKYLTLTNCSEFSNDKMDSLFTQLRHLNGLTLYACEYTIEDMHQLLRSIPHLKRLTVNIRHEDTIHIDEYKMWMTEITQRVDLCFLQIKVTNLSEYRWIEEELRVHRTSDKLFISLQTF